MSSPLEEQLVFMALVMFLQTWTWRVFLTGFEKSGFVRMFPVVSYTVCVHM